MITNFKAGGLLRSTTLGDVKPRLGILPGHSVPLAIDNRYDCTPADDQGNVPACAAYSMAKLIEAKRWKATGIQFEIDPLPIYKVAKEQIDRNDQPGTYLTSVFEAAKILSLIPSHARYEEITELIDVQTALHKYDYVLGGFNCISGWNNCSPASGFINERDEVSLGGHAVFVCAYELGKWIGWQNSWANWGYKGFGRMTEECFRRTFMSGLVVIY